MPVNILAAALCVMVFCGDFGFSKGFLLDGVGTCVGKCDQHFDANLMCQCNTRCPHYGNCCPDYGSSCLGQAPGTGCNQSFSDITEDLWKNDVNRLDASMYAINFQHHVNTSTHSDFSPAPFFSMVDTVAVSSRPTFQTFLALQDNYQPVAGRTDHLTSHQLTEVDNFLDAVLGTTVFHVLLEYLQCQNLVSSESDLRDQLKKLWFTPYPRHPGGASDSSGFEHVMVGEYKNSNTVNGLHSWLAFYTKEKAHQINYYGYVWRKSPDLVGLNYVWNGHHKALGAFFVGTSPEFDLALYTLCTLTRQGNVRLGGHRIFVQTYDISHVTGLQVATAYPN
ncbi:uridylate-specific endoribonuclease A-like [Babylonia areolata]|uniref:uridylate-specific endoribonuclease A-like n=1 Tax=Babylonia areolata TaxID=304850 RepID=UPI003FD24C6E